MHHPTDRITHTSAFATPVVEHWLRYIYIYLTGEREEVFYLTTHSTHFIYNYMASDQSARERKPAFATTWATILDWQQGIFSVPHPTVRIAHTTSFVTPANLANIFHLYVSFVENI